MYKIHSLYQEKNNQLSFVFETLKQYFVGNNIILKIEDELFVAEVVSSIYTVYPSDYDTFKIDKFTYTAKTILEIDFKFLNRPFSIIEFVNNESNRKLLYQQEREYNQI